jgi:tryptophanyl-tRNA synthetase
VLAEELLGPAAKLLGMGLWKDMSMSEVFTLLAGCRASQGGLHLGHVYGCLQDLPPGRDTLYFVIDDTYTARVGPTAVADIALDALACAPTGVDVRPVRSSRLQGSLQPIVRELYRNVTWPQLRAAHPRHKDIRDNAYVEDLQDLLFPIRDAARLIGMRCDIACFNDDNVRFVDFARRSARRIRKNRGLTENLDIPHLRLRRPGRLLSFDGQKMARDKKNALFVSATTDQVALFAKRVVWRSLPQNARRELIEQAMPSATEFCIHRTFGSMSARDVQQLRGRDRVDALVQALTEYLAPIHSAREQLDLLMPNADTVTTRLLAHERSALDQVGAVLHELGLEET